MPNFKNIFIIFVMTIVFVFIVDILQAQCPMCKMSAEADLKNGGTNAKGLNTGIVYMLIFPYILLGTVGYIWYRERKKIGEEEQIAELRALMEPHDWK